MKFITVITLALFSAFNLKGQLLEITRPSDNSIEICGSGQNVNTSVSSNLIGLPIAQLFSLAPSDVESLTYTSDPTLPFTINGESVANVEVSSITGLLVISIANDISTPMSADGCVTIQWQDGILSDAGSTYEVYHMNTSNIIASGSILPFIPPSQDVPTLSEWGIIVLSLLFLIISVSFIKTYIPRKNFL